MTATTAEALHPRLALLVDLVRRQGGERTTRRVERAYADHGYRAPQRHTHRHDLDALHRMGILDRRETTGRRWYVPSRQTTEQTRGNR
jgi:hypothetical protein